MPKTVLVPIDLDQVAHAPAMIEAARLVGGADAAIVLVNVVQDLPGYLSAELPVELPRQLMQEARARLRDIGREHGLEPAVEARSGNAASTILEVARDRKADVIVIASHRPGLQDYFLGSTAARVVRHAPCSVYVLR